MLNLRKKEIKDGIIYYYYQIECKGEWGELFYDPATGHCGWNKLAEGDEDWYDRYRGFAYMTLMDFHKENFYPDEQFVGWGISVKQKNN